MINAKTLSNIYKLDKFIKFWVNFFLVYINTVTLPGSMHNTVLLHKYQASLCM